MTLKLLEKVVSKYSELDIENPTFSWHGGEPLLFGLENMEKAMDLQKKYFNGRGVVNLVQTNGTLINLDMATFLAENNFIVSVSLDGSAEVHDRNRKFGENGSFGRVMAGVDVLRSVGLNTSVIATVTKENLEFSKEVFTFLVNQGFTSIKYSPVYDSNRDAFSISSDEWFNYLSEVFDLWMGLASTGIRVRELDEVIVWLKKDRLNLCATTGGCSKWMSVDPEGNIYPCEYLRSKFSYGNILCQNFCQIMTSSEFVEFGRLVSVPNIQCSECEFYDFCGNGCPATRVDFEGNISYSGQYIYCNQRKRLYQKIKTDFEKILGHGI